MRKPDEGWNWDYLFALTAGEVLARNGAGDSAVLRPGEAVLWRADENWSLEKLLPTEGFTLQPTEGEGLDVAALRQAYSE